MRLFRGLGFLEAKKTLDTYSTDTAQSRWHRDGRSFLLRTLVFALFAYLIFGWLCIPVRVAHSGMEPTYRSGRMNFCWRPAYWFAGPDRHAVVFLRVPGARGFLLRRVIAIEGERIEMHDGVVYINGLPLEEPYVASPCEWNMPPGVVAKDSVFVIGDNREAPMDQVMFGQVAKSEIAGGPLW